MLGLHGFLMYTTFFCNYGLSMIFNNLFSCLFGCVGVCVGRVLLSCLEYIHLFPINFFLLNSLKEISSLELSNKEILKIP